MIFTAVFNSPSTAILDPVLICLRLLLCFNFMLFVLVLTPRRHIAHLCFANRMELSALPLYNSLDCCSDTYCAVYFCSKKRLIARELFSIRVAVQISCRIVSVYGVKQHDYMVTLWTP